MGAIQDRLNEDKKAAMKAGEKLRLGVIRMVIAALEDMKLQKSLDDLEEADEMAVLRKAVKMRRDSIDQAEKAGRAEIAAAEQAEIEVIEGYLPETLSGEALEAKVRELASEIEYSGAKDKGRFMKAWMARYRGLAEGRDVQAALGRLEADA